MLRRMAGPIWLNWIFAALMTLAALFHAGRLLAASQRGQHRGYDGDLTDLVMSSAMAALLVINFGAHMPMTLALSIGLPTLWLILRALRAIAAKPPPRRISRALTPATQQLPMYAAMLFMLLVSGRSASTTPTEAMGGMTMGGPLSQGLGGSTPLVTLTTVVFVGVLGLVAAGHARQLRGAIATQRAWPLPDRSDRRKVIGELVLAPGPSLLCQLAMSGTMIYMLVLMVQPVL
jgi:Domain of unknown function (DUF5134)